jgi:hypothetical protein
LGSGGGLPPCGGFERNPFAFVQEKPALLGFIGFRVVPVLR